VVVLDYLAHEDDALRAEAGDVWLGFPVDEVRRFFTEAGLEPVADAPVSSAFHPQGSDAALAWHTWVAQRPFTQQLDTLTHDTLTQKKKKESP